MAGEYDLNLSNGSAFATLYPLETSGPDNVSVPRLIQEARPQYQITNVTGGSGTSSFTIIGDSTPIFRVGFTFQVVGSTANDATYVVTGVTFAAGNTTIDIADNLTDTTADGSLIAHVFRLVGDMTYRFVSGFVFNVQNSHTTTTHAVVLADNTVESFKITDDHTSTFTASQTFTVTNSTSNNGTYTVVSSSFVAGETTILVSEDVVGNDTDGLISVITDTNVNGTYTVDATLGSSFSGTDTWIPVGNGNIRDNLIAPIGVPLGEIIYTHLDTVSSLQLPGKGTMNYGEKLIEDLVRMTEHFAADTAPDLNTVIGTTPAATPLVGQLWYNTTVGSEGFNVWTGTGWTPDNDLDTGALIFRDLESASTSDDIYITASETNLPVGYVGTDEPGIIIWQEVTPTPGEATFRVIDAVGAEALRVEYAGNVTTTNNLEIKGTGESYFRGNLNIDGTTFLTGLADTAVTYQAALLAAATSPGAADSLIPNIGYMEAPMRAEKGPTGITNRVDSTISFVDGTRTFTIAPAVTSFDYWIHGAKYVVSAAINHVITDVEGMHYLYLDTAGAIQELAIFDTDVLLKDSAYLCAIYWDFTNKVGVYVADERHGLTMDADTHIHFQLTFGCQYVDGLALGNMDSENGTPTDASSKFDVGDGTIRNEDIQHNIVDTVPQTLTGDAEIPIFYRDGASANWRSKTADTFPYIYSGSAGYVGGSGLPAYNLDTVGTWSLTEATNGKYFLMHFLATNDILHPIVGICGINEYNNHNDAYDGANSELQTLAGLPFEEFTPIATVLYQVNTSYSGTTNLIRQRDVEISPGIFAEYVDWRDVGTFTSVIGGGGITDHGNLSGLADDDHAQYVHIDGTHVMAGDLTLANNTPTTDEHAASKLFVETTVAGISWREPVRVLDDTAYANSTFFPTSGVIDGVTLAVDDRVLFSFTILPTDRDVFIWDGAAWTADPLNPRSVGDTVFIQEGSSKTKARVFSNDGEWEVLGGVGTGLNVQYETQTAIASQTVFNLATVTYSPNVNRLQVYVDGVKQIITLAYNETDPATVTFIGPSPFVGGEVLEFIAYDELIANAVAKREQQTGLVGNPNPITLVLMTYQVASDNLLVFVNGQKMIKAIDYIELTNNTINWIGTPLLVTDVLEFYSSVPIVAGTKLRDIDDVSAAVPVQGDVLVYNNTLGIWEPNSYTVGGKISDYVTGTVGSTLSLTNVSALAKTIDTSFIQVFVNGILQREDVSGFPQTGNYFVAGTSQLTFAVALVATDEVLVYTL